MYFADNSKPNYSMSDLEFNKNEDNMRIMLVDLKYKKEQAALGGGQKSIDRHKAKGKLTARERIAMLLDEGTPQLEIGSLAGDGMYPEYGGCCYYWLCIWQTMYCCSE